MNKLNFHSLKYLNSLCIFNSFYFNHFRVPFNIIIEINSSVSDSNLEKNVNFIKTLWLLEHTLSQKGFVKNFKLIRMGRNDRRVIFSAKCCITKINAINLLYFFDFFMVVAMTKKLLKLPTSLDFNSYFFFVLPDVSVFPGLFIDFFKWKYSFVIRVGFVDNKDISYINNKYCFQNVGFVLI